MVKFRNNYGKSISDSSFKEGDYLDYDKLKHLIHFNELVENNVVVKRSLQAYKENLLGSKKGANDDENFKQKKDFFIQVFEAETTRVNSILNQRLLELEAQLTFIDSSIVNLKNEANLSPRAGQLENIQTSSKKMIISVPNTATTVATTTSSIILNSAAATLQQRRSSSKKKGNLAISSDEDIDNDDVDSSKKYEFSNLQLDSLGSDSNTSSSATRGTFSLVINAVSVSLDTISAIDFPWSNHKVSI